MTQPKLKRDDVVKIAPNGIFGILTAIQEVHNRYQLHGVSGWQYGLSYLEKSSADALLEENKRLERQEEENQTMYRRNFAVLESQLQQTREELNQVKAERDKLKDLRLHRMEIENGGINFSISGEAGMTFAAILFKFYEDNGGKNFFSFDLEKDDKRYNVTITNLNGEMSITAKLSAMESELDVKNKVLEGYASLPVREWQGDSLDIGFKAREVLLSYPPREKGADNEHN